MTSDLAGRDNEYYVIPATISSVGDLKVSLCTVCCVCVNDVLFKKKEKIFPFRFLRLVFCTLFQVQNCTKILFKVVL